MANCLFSFPDRLIPTPYAAPALSGGAWSGLFPLINLQDPDRSLPARSTNCLAASTKIDIDFGTLRDIRALALLNHNLTLAATVRFIFYSDAGRTQILYDTGAMLAHRPWYPQDALNWGHPDLWHGQLSVEDRDGWEFEAMYAIPLTIARYARCEIVDTANPDGYVELSRLWMGPAWEPPYNMEYGATFGWATDAKTERTLGGRRHVQELSRWREATFRLSGMTPGQAMGALSEMQRRLGMSGELLFIYDPEDEFQALWLRSFLCNFEDLSPIEYPWVDANQSAIKLVEVL